jgi:uncharacterized Zn finger protein (UPF0148 family)
MSKRKAKTPKANRGLLARADKRFAAKNSTVVCPVCGVRFPALTIRKHVAVEHPRTRVSDQDLRSKTYVRRTRAKAAKPTKEKMVSPKPYQGGLPSLGSRS